MNAGSFVLKIRKRTFPHWLVMWMAVLPLLMGTFFDLLSLPAFIKYTADIAWVLVLIIGVTQKKWSVNKSTKPIWAMVLVFILYVFVVYIFRYQSALYFLWGFRNNFRYYAFFMGVVLFFSQEDIPSLFRLFNICFWLNFLTTLVQFFVFGYRGDFLGGIFGIQKGCNGYSIIFLCVVVGYSLLSFMSKKESLWVCLLKCGAALCVAALAELKVFFVLFVMLVVMSSLLTSFSWKKVWILFGGTVLLYIASSLVASLFQLDDAFSIEQLWELATQENYSSQDTVNRLSAIPTLAKSILKDPHDRIFGLGLGNCDTATFEFLNTPFFQRFFYLRYVWFSCAIVFLEMGYIGVAAVLSFFVVCFVLIRKQIKNAVSNKIICSLGLMMAVVSVILFFYNASLRGEMGYIVYLILALPFVRDTSTANQELVS